MNHIIYGPFGILKPKKVCIEDLTELREWMETVPIELENLTEEVEHAVNDYELVEEFYYPLREVFKSLSDWLLVVH